MCNSKKGVLGLGAILAAGVATGLLAKKYKEDRLFRAKVEVAKETAIIKTKSFANKCLDKFNEFTK